MVVMPITNVRTAAEMRCTMRLGDSTGWAAKERAIAVVMRYNPKAKAPATTAPRTHRSGVGCWVEEPAVLGAGVPAGGTGAEALGVVGLDISLMGILAEG